MAAVTGGRQQSGMARQTLRARRSRKDSAGNNCQPRPVHPDIPPPSCPANRAARPLASLARGVGLQ
jgi:hypothetical protein